MTITQPSSSPATVNRPRIPDEELRQRPLAFGRLLARAGFDAWIGFGDDRAVAGPDHIRYFVDLEPHFEPVLLAGRSSASEARAAHRPGDGGIRRGGDQPELRCRDLGD